MHRSIRPPWSKPMPSAARRWQPSGCGVSCYPSPQSESLRLRIEEEGTNSKLRIVSDLWRIVGSKATTATAASRPRKPRPYECPPRWRVANRTAAAHRDRPGHRRQGSSTSATQTSWSWPWRLARSPIRSAENPGKFRLPHPAAL